MDLAHWTSLSRFLFSNPYSCIQRFHNKSTGFGCSVDCVQVLYEVTTSFLLVLNIYSLSNLFIILQLTSWVPTSLRTKIKIDWLILWPENCCKKFNYYMNFTALHQQATAIHIVYQEFLFCYFFIIKSYIIC